jgi:hypothetical protein
VSGISGNARNMQNYYEYFKTVGIFGNCQEIPGTYWSYKAYLGISRIRNSQELLDAHFVK